MTSTQWDTLATFWNRSGSTYTGATLAACYPDLTIAQIQAFAWLLEYAEEFGGD